MKNEHGNTGKRNAAKDVSEKASKSFRFRCTDEIDKKIRQSAKEKGVDVTKWILNLIISELNKESPE